MTDLVLSKTKHAPVVVVLAGHCPPDTYVVSGSMAGNHIDIFAVFRPPENNLRKPTESSLSTFQQH